MDQLLFLPEELWKHHILDFTTIVDIARATKAILNRVAHKQFLELTNGHTSMEGYLMRANSSRKHIQWCQSRNIMLGNALLGDDMDQSLIEKFRRISSLYYVCYSATTSNEHLTRTLEVYQEWLKRLKVHCYRFCLPPLSACVLLETLQLTNCSKITTKSLLNSLAGCKKLKDITIDDCQLVDEDAIVHIIADFPNLEAVTYRGTAQHPYCFRTIMDTCKRTTTSLRKIVLSGCTFTEQSLPRLVEFAPHLQQFETKSICNVTDADVLNLMHNCAHLTVLSIRNSRQWTIGPHSQPVEIEQPFPAVQQPNADSNYRICDVGKIPVTIRCTQVKVLKISNCIGVSDLSVREIWTNCLLLDELDLSDCKQLTDFAFPVVEGRERRSIMDVLDVSGTMITGVHFLKSRYVRKLLCNRCLHINSRLIVQDVTGFMHTEHLRFTSVQIDPPAFLELAAHLPSLLGAYFDYSSVNDAVLHALVEHCPKLRLLNVEGCEAVTQDTVKQLLSVHANKIVIVYRAPV